MYWAYANARAREYGFDPCDGYYRSHGKAVVLLEGWTCPKRNLNITDDHATLVIESLKTIKKITERGSDLKLIPFGWSD